ncbi:hypothetical protein [Streptomyces justiciae]|uniref:Uncharacterized protein n=1 Tax=Streptomyces justiciae TaxID=2780140 RepID=A0ABU3M8C6_9ACTN|nr:hypothetical protein [Streptomyces justiciae]MDT7847174.1 hypothetical protein [Streptomyces justiciae]
MTSASRSTPTIKADTAAREAVAAQSAGRAGGYCWVEEKGGGYSCTLRPAHGGKHYHFYSGTEFD